MEVPAFYIHRQPLRIHTMMFHENQQVQLLSDAEDFVTVDSGPGGNTDCVRYCTRFHMELRYRMDGTMDLRRVNYTLVDEQHVRR